MCLKIIKANIMFQSSPFLLTNVASHNTNSFFFDYECFLKWPGVFQICVDIGFGTLMHWHSLQLLYRIFTLSFKSTGNQKGIKSGSWNAHHRRNESICLRNQRSTIARKAGLTVGKMLAICGNVFHSAFLRNQNMTLKVELSRLVYIWPTKLEKWKERNYHLRWWMRSRDTVRSYLLYGLTMKYTNN